ncbi:MAG: hypothetical protein KME67_11065 [Candidatus Thiodiazotropha sp. (ex Codakia orbicularis)]|nr:hypothetical protein [Candidatus Thiodiazotropha sp. (ex Codakia orbicularis)]
MKYRRRTKTNWPLTVGGIIAILTTLAGLGYFAFQAYGKPVADRYGCFDGVNGKQTHVLIDVSAPRFDGDQQRALMRYFKQEYDRLAFGDRMSVYTTEGDQQASVLSPRFHICGPAREPEHLTAIGADGGSSGYIEKQRQRLYEKRFLPELEAVLTDNPDDERRQTTQSPILEMVADLSRMPNVGPGAKITLVSDLIQNAPDSAQFCQVKNDMPPFALFSQRRVYQGRLKPRSLEGVQVEVLMLLRPAYGPFCRDEDEIRRFWIDYFRANGVKEPRVIRIRHGLGG